MAAEAAEHTPEYVPIDRCVAGPGISLEVGVDSLYSGCQCEDLCVREGGGCNCKISYDARGGNLFDEYLLPESPAVFECNSKCTCSSKCPNRTTQHLPNVAVEVFKTEKKGFGVRTTHAVQKGTFVGEYVGEVITTDLATKRLQSLQDSDSCYILQYKEHMSSGLVLTTNIDASFKGNITRFVNHSCSPNLTMVAVRSDSIVPRLCLFSARDIGGCEEICFSYFGQPGAQIVASDGIQFGKKQCLCGSEDCIGFLPLQT